MAARGSSMNSGVASARRGAMMVAAALLFAAAPVFGAVDDWHYKVKPGDTLSSVAQTYCKSPNDWKALQRINGVPNTRRLMPGTRLTIPVRLIRKADAFARAMMVRGQVSTVDAKGKPLAKVRRGARLKVGDTVHTGAHSTLMLLFVDKSRMLVSQNSTIKLLNLINYGNTGIAQTQVQVTEGGTESKVSHQMGGAAKYEVNTPIVNLAVRGTDFRVRVTGAKGQSSAEVAEGFVAAAADGGQEMVHHGYGLKADPGKPLAKPVQLLAPPTLSPVAAVFKHPPVKLQWKAMKGAGAYRVQLFSPDPTTGDLLVDRRTKETTLTLKDLPDGEYAVRVRAIATNQLQGRDRAVSFKVGEGPVPPRPVKPISGDEPGGRKVLFTWSGVKSAATYQFEVSDRDDFSHLVARVSTIPSARHGVLIPLKPGRYSWRVASVSAGGLKGGYSVPQTFVLESRGGRH